MSLTARIITEFSSVDARDWERLSHGGNPFLSYDFLAALETTESIGPHAGWHPHHLALFENGELVAFAPTYAKDNSHGEFVFDWAWADAYHRHGLQYYPKLLTGIPYSPVSGPRLLVRKGHAAPGELKATLIKMALSACHDGGFSTWHCNFITADDFDALDGINLLRRRDWQFHWFNQGYTDFDQFLASLRSRKRKNLRRERRQVLQAGIRVEWRAGDVLNPDELDFIYRCYIDTFHNYGNYPALKKSFFEAIAKGLKDGFQAAIAYRDGERIAMAVFLVGGGRLYGRYWGCIEEIPGLHFELSYYQGIEFCIAHELQVFESGAQGEHKVGRGFIPTQTRSFHHVENAAFREAIADHLKREKQWIDQYREQLEALVPYRQDQS